MFWRHVELVHTAGIPVYNGLMNVLGKKWLYKYTDVNGVAALQGAGDYWGAHGLVSST